MFRSYLILVPLLLLSLIGGKTAAEEKSVHHVKPESCKQCHEEIYLQWQGSMHAMSSAMKDPIHGAFYRNVVGDPTKEGVTKGGKYPVCHKCHAPVAALEGSTKIDAKPAYENGISCVTCHSFKSFKGNDTADGKPLYGIDAYEVDSQSLYGPSGITYTTKRMPEDSKWPAPVHHAVPLEGNKSALFKSNDACMGCHEKRSNANQAPLCRTGKEYRDADSFVACQACHMPVVEAQKMKDGKAVPGETVAVADHSMFGGHSDKMITRGVALDMEAERDGDLLKARVTVRNRLPHSYPTGAPFRNAYLKLAVYDEAGNELWKNYKVHPIKDDPDAAFWYALGKDGKPAMPPVATELLFDNRLKPNEVRVLEYEIPVQKGMQIVRAEVYYDLLLPPIKAKSKGKLPDELLQPKLAASVEIRR